MDSRNINNIKILELRNQMPYLSFITFEIRWHTIYCILYLTCDDLWVTYWFEHLNFEVNGFLQTQNKYFMFCNVVGALKF